MLSYRFREGVHVDFGESVVVVTTPYATRLNSIQQSLQIDRPTDSLKILLRDLLDSGVGREHISCLDDSLSANTERLELLGKLDYF